MGRDGAYDTILISDSRVAEGYLVVNDVPAHGFAVGGLSLSFTATTLAEGKRTAQ